VPAGPAGSLARDAGVIARALVVRTVRRDPWWSVRIDGASNLSTADQSEAAQVDAEHQATDLAVG